MNALTMYDVERVHNAYLAVCTGMSPIGSLNDLTRIYLRACQSDFLRQEDAFLLDRIEQYVGTHHAIRR